VTPTTASGPDPSAPSSHAPITRPATPPLLGPWLLLALGVLAAVVAVTTDPVRLGGYLLAGSLGAVALLRAVLPPRLAGAVVVRSRGTDTLLLTGAAVAAAVLASTLNLAGS
jgi:hypothetical protein